MRTGRLGCCRASLSAAGAAVADAAVWQETTASFPSIRQSAMMPLCPRELNAVMPFSSGFTADVFYCHLENGFPDPHVWESASALWAALPVLIMLPGARRPSPLHDFGRSVVQQFLHGYWYTIGCRACGCEHVHASHIFHQTSMHHQGQSNIVGSLGGKPFCEVEIVLSV